MKNAYKYLAALKAANFDLNHAIAEGLSAQEIARRDGEFGRLTLFQQSVVVCYWHYIDMHATTQECLDKCIGHITKNSVEFKKSREVEIVEFMAHVNFMLDIGLGQYMHDSNCVCFGKFTVVKAESYSFIYLGR